MSARTCCARAAKKRRSSVSGKTGSSPRFRTSLRISSAEGVPPGSRVRRTGIPAALSEASSRSACVDFPDPSIPSRVTKRPGTGGLGALPRRLLQASALRCANALRLGLPLLAALLTVLLNVVLDHLPRLVVRDLDRRRLLEVGRRRDLRARKAVVERQLRAADRVDDDAGRIG